MKIIRFENNDRVLYGMLIGEVLKVLEDDIFTKISQTGQTIAFDKDQVKIIAPVEPTKIIGVGRNYFKYIQHRKGTVPTEPLIFFKPPSSIIAHMEKVIWPNNAQEVACEGELGIVIGKKTKGISEDQAHDYVFGYTIVNDMTIRDYMVKGVNSSVDKGFDTSTPIGPVIETDLDPSDLSIEIRINGVPVKASRTDDMVFNTAQLVSFISGYLTLLPGDIISS